MAVASAPPVDTFRHMTTTPKPPPDVAKRLVAWGVDDARLEALGRYVAILDRWRQRINLIGPGDLDEIWRRHVLDSAQAWPHVDDPTAPLLDLGSGAGLPGLILSILGATDVTLVDSDQRKTAFLREAAREAGVRPTIVAARFDAALAGREGAYLTVTGRAVAPLSRLAPVLAQALAPAGYALLHKGAQVEKELTEAGNSWTMRHILIPSITGSGGVLAKIWGLQQNGEPR